MRIEPIKNNVSIVFVGSFNAIIFHPEWFVSNNILSKDDLKSSEVELIHREVSIFKVGDWLRISVDPNRFIAETTEPPFIRLCDLIVKTFGEALVHTPIHQLGINRAVHFSVGQEEIRNKIGKTLAPQTAWGEWASLIEGKSIEKRGGMMSLTMRQKDIDDRENGHIEARVAPSGATGDKAGIMVAVNDHYQISEKGKITGAAQAVDLLVKQFDESIRRSEWIIDQIMALKDKV